MRSALFLVASALLASCHPPCPVEPAASDRWEPAAKQLPEPPPKPPGAVRFIVGGDSREAFPFAEGPDGAPRDLARCDLASPLALAMADAKPAGAAAFLYLGDMERSPPVATRFPAALSRCLDASVAFCPVFGNHEALDDGRLPLLYPEVAREDFARDFLPSCLRRGVASMDAVTPEAPPAGRVFYAIDLPGNVHFVALDNVSAAGFGRAQLDWLDRDLRAASARGMLIVAGMHKALADNHVTHHSMDEDGAPAERDSQEALARFEEHGVALLLASHEHGFWEIRQRSPGTGASAGTRGFITGGLGAPLKVCAGPEHAFFHFLVLDVVGKRVDVTVVRVPGHAR